jgi:tetratricopeptide (TPR) repeat protein
VPAAILGLAGWLWVWPILKPGPLFKKGDRVIIADFVNQTGNPHYDTAIQEIFAAFWGSDVLTILEQDPKRTEALTAAVLEARCAKGECEGYMTGRIAREGTGYVLEVGLHRAGLHKQAMSRQEHVPDDQNLVTGIESLVSLFDGDVRRAVGAAAPAPVGEDCPEPYPSVQGCLAWLKAERYGFQNPAEMVPMLQRALDLDPGFLYARGRLGLAYANMGNMMEARRHLGEATHGYAALEEKHPGCRERQLYYEILYLGQRYDIAAQLERLNRYLQLFPDAGDMHNVLSGTLNREYMDYAAAEPHARKCYELSPLPGHFSNLVGNLAAQGKASAIEALIAEYRARDVWGGPKMKEEAIARAEIRLAEARGEDWNRIIDLIDRVNAEGRLARETVRQDRGVYLLMAGRLSEAEETLQESVRGEELDRMKTGQSVWKPNVDLLWLEWRRTGRVPVLSPEHIAFLNGNLDSIDANDFGVYSVAMGQAHPLEEVLRHHEEVEKDNLNETVREKLQFGRGCLAMIEGRATEAVALLDPLARDSDYTPRHHVLARAYEAVGRWSDAARSYEIVLKGRPIGNIQPYAVRVLDEPRLAGIYERLGNTERARYWYGRFLSDWRNADPGTPEVEDAKKRLAELGGPLPAGA